MPTLKVNSWLGVSKSTINKYSYVPLIYIRKRTDTIVAFHSGVFQSIVFILREATVTRSDN
jgi:hypothetical protein